jgi:serine protease Do
MRFHFISIGRRNIKFRLSPGSGRILRMHFSRSVLFSAVLTGFLLGASPGRAQETGAGAEEGSAANVSAELKGVEEIAKSVRPSLVKVTQFGREGVYGVGSGFVISAEGLIATNRHVIGEARRIKVETSDGVEHAVTEVFASDHRLDLAILRVATKGLKPLDLGDSALATQGQPVVVMGNPGGLSYSLVGGFVSEAQREIEGVPMIQVAAPIIEGNSGGPLLDRRGRVLGVLTLRSALAENLGFAMPVNTLKRLLEKPNPIPMERWLTIGVLNPRFWLPRMGGQWTQRASILNVEQTGNAGRSLCLWKTPPPTQDFEAAVSVRLQEEAGAAGLAFCADAEDRHYGFYPTAGKLRLTRFDGPNVFTWKVLGEVASKAYLSGDWNTLRVRVEGRWIRCYVNETLVLEVEDDVYRGGLSGLCKFRQPAASFKHFKLGTDLGEKTTPAEVDASLRGSIELALGGTVNREDALQALMKDPESGGRALKDRRKDLERSVALLKELGVELHRRAVRAELVAELSLPEEKADLFRCALLLAKHDNPELDISAHERAFDQMVEELREDPQLAGETKTAVERINRFLFEENGFHGSRSDSGNRSNSYINEVLDDREGLPITLAVVYIELARRLGVEGVVGIPLPSRFMVGYRVSEEDPMSLVDVFNGGKFLTMDEAIADVSTDGWVPDKARQPASKREIILRMIQNLMGAPGESGAASLDSLPYLDLALALNPDSGRERVSRAAVRERLGDREGARGDVSWLLEHLPANVPEDSLSKLQAWLERLEGAERR